MHLNLRVDRQSTYDTRHKLFRAELQFYIHITCNDTHITDTWYHQVVFSAMEFPRQGRERVDASGKARCRQLMFVLPVVRECDRVGGRCSYSSIAGKVRNVFLVFTFPPAAPPSEHYHVAGLHVGPSDNINIVYRTYDFTAVRFCPPQKRVL